MEKSTPPPCSVGISFVRRAELCAYFVLLLHRLREFSLDTELGKMVLRDESTYIISRTYKFNNLLKERKVKLNL